MDGDEVSQVIPCIGVDPGVKGGLAVLSYDGEPVLVDPFRPEWTQAELVGHLRSAADLLFQRGGRVAFVEKVGVMPHDGRKGANTFGRVDGLIRGALLALNVIVRDVPPMIWQTRLQCLSGGNKNVTKAKAQELFPRVKVTHNIADALLIARYGWESLIL